MSDSPRAAAPIVERPDSLPPRWLGGEPRFPIDARFHVAAFRGELAHLLALARRFRLSQGLPSSGVAAAMATELWELALGVVRHREALEAMIRADPSWSVDPVFRIAAAETIAALKAERVARPDPADHAAWLASPETIAALESLYGLTPAVELDFAAPPAVAGHAAEAPPARPEAAPTPAREAPSAALNPGSRALAAAYQLEKERKPVSVRAACELSGVDRATLRRNYPDAQAAIEALSKPVRAPRRGYRDRRTGDLHALDFEDSD